MVFFFSWFGVAYFDVMSSTFTIQLHNLRLNASHGVYAEEALAGNNFELNLSLTVAAPEATLRSIEESINYAEVYQIVKEMFAVREALLETLAMEIAAKLKQQFPALQQTSIQIIKLHPPISAFTGSVSVTYDKIYNEPSS